MSTDLKHDFAGIPAHLALANIGPNTTFIGDLASPGALRNLEEATFKGLKDLLDDAAADFIVKAEKVNNTTAKISMRVPCGVYQDRSAGASPNCQSVSASSCASTYIAVVDILEQCDHYILLCNIYE